MKVGERLARQIVSDLLADGIPVGSSLGSEAAMIAKYEVARPTLREALRLLEVQGLIVLRPGPGGGPMLQELSASDFARMTKLYLQMRHSTYREVLEARLALEPLMARLAATTRPPQGLRRLAELLAELEGEDLGNEATWQARSDAFHALVSSMSGNSVLDLLGPSLKEIYFGRRRAPAAETARTVVRAAHIAVARAILDGDPDEAERRMREHMVGYAESTTGMDSDVLGAAIIWD